MSAHDERYLFVTAQLREPLAGDPPYLDALILAYMAHVTGTARPIDRGGPLPDVEPPTLIAHRQLGRWKIPRCSGPILGTVLSDRHEHYAQRFEAQRANVLEPDQRIVLNTTGGSFKSHRLPLRVRDVRSVGWYCVARDRLRRRELRNKVRKIESIGKKTSIGYGVVERWEIVDVDVDWSWFAPHESGLVLMRPLPVGPWIPEGMVGARQAYHAVCAPYWHPERHTEAWVPC